MFCIVMLIALVVLSACSATSRGLAREALDCVLRKATLRPCTTGFDEKMKARILGSVINRSESAARILNKNFELLSWLFFILFVASTIWVARGMYLFYVTGSCSGLNKESFCLLDPKGASNMVSLTGSCPIKPKITSDLTLKGVDLSGFPTLNPHGRGQIVMIGCYGCEYTRRVYPVLKELALNSNASFTFIDYPVKVQSDLMTRVGRCVYLSDRSKYWKMNDVLFSTAKSSLDSASYAIRLVSELGLDGKGVERCADSPETAEVVARQLAEAGKTRFYGTPTVFVDGQVLVGPKPYRVYAIALRGVLYWLPHAE